MKRQVEIPSLPVEELERDGKEPRSFLPLPTQLSTDHYKLLYENTPSMSFALTPDGTILSVNRFGAEQLGYESELLTGESVLLVFDPADHNTVRGQLMICAQNPYSIFLWDIQKVHRSGRRLWVRETARAVRDGHGTLIVLVMCEDITARKAAEEQIHSTVQELQALIHMSPLAVMALDPTGETVTRWNRAAESMFGWRAEEVLGRPTPFLPSESRDESDRLWATLLREGSLSAVELRRTRRDGSPIDLALWATILRNPQGTVTGTLGFLADITERKRAIEALRESEKRFRALYDQAPLGIAIIDSISGRFEQINQKYCEITSYSKADMLARTFQSITHPDDLQADLNNMADLLSGRTDAFRMEKRYIRKDRSIVWVNLTCVPLWLDVADRRLHIAMVEDITDRKGAAGALQQSEHRLKSIIQTSPECIKLVAPDGSLLEMNAAGLAMVEAEKPEDVIGQSAYRLVAPAYREAFREMNERVCCGNNEFLEFEIIGLRGTHRWMETHGVPLRNPTDGRTVQLAIARDITERKRTEEALRQNERNLQRLLDDRERISRDLHDEVLQSLYAVGMGLELTKRRIRRISPANVKRLEDSVKQLNMVIREVRNFIPRMDAPTVRTGNVADALRSLVDSFISTGAGEIALSLDDNAAMRVSPEQCAQVLAIAREALSNSIRHTKATKRTVDLRQERGKIRLEITDNGDGFAIGRRRIRGMGLKNMRARARTLRARLTIASAPKRGTEVILLLPSP